MENRSASSWDTVDLPAAITPVTTMTCGTSTARWRGRSVTWHTLEPDGAKVARVHATFKFESDQTALSKGPLDWVVQVKWSVDSPQAYASTSSGVARRTTTRVHAPT
ncbi:hypothetical protein GCM10027053_26860 [Intrasporangium mesophilum]